MDEVLESRARQMFSEDVAGTSLATFASWPTDASWISEELRRAYRRAAEHERDSQPRREETR